jgi:uncharacterized membrane protein YqjE
MKNKDLIFKAIFFGLGKVTLFASFLVAVVALVYWLVEYANPWFFIAFMVITFTIAVCGTEYENMKRERESEERWARWEEDLQKNEEEFDAEMKSIRAIQKKSV